MTQQVRNRGITHLAHTDASLLFEGSVEKHWANTGTPGFLHRHWPPMRTAIPRSPKAKGNRGSLSSYHVPNPLSPAALPCRAQLLARQSHRTPPRPHPGPHLGRSALPRWGLGGRTPPSPPTPLKLDPPSGPPAVYELIQYLSIRDRFSLTRWQLGRDRRAASDAIVAHQARRVSDRLVRMVDALRSLL